MNSQRFFFCFIFILGLICASATQAQQQKVSEPDAPATATRPATQAQPVSGVPHEIKFSAVLKDSTGKPLTGTVAVTFALYDQQEGGTASWSETQNVEVDAQGRYSVLLGAASSAGVLTELFRATEGPWLGVRVLTPGHTEQPRVRWVSVPYALKAGDAETLGGRPASSYVVAVDPASSPSASAPVSAAITGSGTPGFISKFTAATTLGNSVLFEKTGNIGLGTTTPSSKLSVVGNISTTTISATGSITAGGNIALPNTASASVGVLTLGGTPFLHDFGNSNTFVGAFAGNMFLKGSGNTGVGNFALTNNTTGGGNSAFGFLALSSNTTGGANASFGNGALKKNTTGGANSAFGNAALMTNTTGGANSAFGYNALVANATGKDNSAFGFSALGSNTGDANSAFGRSALAANTTGRFNAAFGFDALQSNTTGFSNSAFGYSALLSNTTSCCNAAFGEGALFSNTAASNSAFGFWTLRQLTTGNSNTAVGDAAGYFLVSGSDDIYIGYVGNSGVTSESKTIRIGTGVQTATFIDGINGQTSASGTGVFINGSGQLGTLTSSQRYKIDIADMAAESELLMKLRPVAFYYKPEFDDTHTRQYGLVAEEVAKVAPQLVVFDKDGAPQTVRYHFVNAMLLNEVQKQRTTIVQQQAELEALTARLAKLEALLTEGQ